jgi:acyl carrier protein
MMQRPELVELFRTTASQIAERDMSQLTEDTVIADLGLDSLAMLELVGAMERELKIRVSDEELVGVQTVRQLVDVLEPKLRSSAASV